MSHSPVFYTHSAQVDVFSAVPLQGNPLAVVLDSISPSLATSTQASFANWTDLSETTFLFPPSDPSKADYSVRIWTPRRELPFAGHPTLGSCAAWLKYSHNTSSSGGEKFATGEQNIITQECGIGLVRIRRDPDKKSRLALAAPGFIKYEPAKEEEISAICKKMNIRREDVLKAQWTDNGPGWVTLLLKSAQAVLNAQKSDNYSIGDLNFGLVGAYRQGAAQLVKAGLLTQQEADAIEEENDTAEKGLQPAAFEIRSIFDHGTLEDPVTGSLNAGIAKWLISEGLAPDSYVASQGTAIGRRGRIYIDREGEEIWVGGDVCDVISGTVAL